MSEPRVIPIRPGAILDKRPTTEPRPTVEVFKLLERVMQPSVDEDLGELWGKLAAVYKEMSLTDVDLAQRLAQLEQDYILTKSQRLYAYVLLSVDRILGHYGLQAVRDAIVHSGYDTDAIMEAVSRIENLKPEVVNFIRSVVDAIKRGPVEVLEIEE